MKIFNSQFSISKNVIAKFISRPLKNRRLKSANTIFWLFALLIFLFALCFFLFAFKKNRQSPPAERQLEKVTLAMGYIPNVQFAPFYVALEKGYFNNQGLEIEFNYGWETDIIALLASGELQFGIGSGDQVILARSQGLKVVDFFNWYQRFPVTIVSLKEQGISQPSDLIGKTVGLPATYGASYLGWQAFMKINNLKEEQINLKIIGYTQVSSLADKVAEAAVCYAMNEPIQLKNSGYVINSLEVADQINLVSNGLLTNEKTIKERPDLVQRFSNAFSHGLKDTLERPEEAFQISKKYIPEMKDEEIQQQVLKACLPFWQASTLGWHNEEQWRQSILALKDLGLIDKEPTLETLFTNQFIQP